MSHKRLREETGDDEVEAPAKEMLAEAPPSKKPRLAETQNELLQETGHSISPPKNDPSTLLLPPNFPEGPQTAAFARILNDLRKRYEEQFQALQLQINELKVYAQRSELARMKLTSELRQLRQDLDDRGIRLTNEIAALNQGLSYASASPQQALSLEELRAPRHETPKVQELAKKGQRIITYEERNRRMPKEAGDILKQWIYAHNSNPYPSEEEKRQLAIQCRITLPQIQSWFSNARQRLLRRLDI